MAPFVGNLMWTALKRVTSLTDEEREMVMNFTGTAIYYPESQQREPDIYAPTLSSLADLLYGRADAGGGNVFVKYYKCSDFAACTTVTELPTYTFEPFTTKVEKLMRSLSDKIATRSGAPTPQEIGFVNSVNEPVYRMLSIGNAVKGSGQAEILIAKYRDVIAVDYTYTFLDRELRKGLDAILTQWKLSLPQQEQARALRERIAALLVQHRPGAHRRLRQGAVVRRRGDPPGATGAATAHQHAAARDRFDRLQHAAAGPLKARAPVVYEIYSYGNNDALYGVFNAVAAMVGANGYTGALAIVVTAGFITALLAYAFAPDKLNGWKWLAGVVLIYSVLLVPRVTVGIVDKLGNQPVKVVANVPLGLGLLGHFTNVVGNTLTELFETAFQVIPGDGALPLELSYQKHGLMFGTRLVKETRTVVFLDPAFRTDLINFVHNCTMFDLADGTVDPKAFATSVDVWALMGNPNPARFSTITAGGNVDVQPCPGVYANLSGRMPAEVARMREHLAYALNVGLDPANAVAAISGEIETAYIKNKLANAGAAAADILRQNALINAIGDTSQIIGQKINDPAALLLGAARAQSSAATNMWYIASGRMAEQALPLVRNVLEALIYALFPLVLLLVMLTSGRTTGMALKAYAVAFIWIQLWPPIYAIFNYMGILASAKDLAAAADLGGGLRGMALQTAAGIYTNAISNQAVVGNLVVSIPVIAWYALKGLEQVGQAAFSGLAGLQSAIGSTAQQAAAGNMSLGNLAFDQAQLAPNRSSAYMHSFSDATGTSHENVTDPRSYRRENRLGSNALNIADVQDMSLATSESSSRLEASATTKSKQADTALSAALNEVLSNTASSGASTASGQLLSAGKTATSGTQAQTLRQVSQQLASDLGIKDTSVAQSAIRIQPGSRCGLGHRKA